MSVKKIILLTAIICNVSSHSLITFPLKMLVNEPVINLRYQPTQTPTELKLPTSDFDNPLQATQLLLGEYLIAHEAYTDSDNQTWLKVDAVQQEDPAQLYPGWIRADQAIEVETFPVQNLVVSRYIANIVDENHAPLMTVSIGTRLHGVQQHGGYWSIILPNEQTAYIKENDVYEITSNLQESVQELRRSIVKTAQLFLGNWYSWGGRSAQHESIFGISSVDCSALLNLCFARHGLQIPRMAHEQLLRCVEVKHGADLQPGDFVFTSFLTRYNQPMDHVMLYMGDNLLLESTFIDGSKVRIIPFTQRVGRTVDSIQSGDLIEICDKSCEMYFGTLFTPELLQELRDHTINNEY